MDIFYSAQPKSENQSTSTFSNSMSYAIVASGEWVLNKHFYFPHAIGFYLKHNEANDERSSYYERIGIRYRFCNHLFAGVTIKAHKDVADIFEWTVGYTLHHDPNKYWRTGYYYYASGIKCEILIVNSKFQESNSKSFLSSAFLTIILFCISHGIWDVYFRAWN